MTDFLDEKRREIDERLAELKPLIEEYQRLEAAAVALQGVGDGAVPTRRGPGRPRRTAGAGEAAEATAATAAAPSRTRRSRTSRTTTRRRAGRRKGSGTRAAQALTLVQEQPGITIPELAARMGIKQNYLYRVLPGLEQEGKVVKQGRAWHPKA